MALLPHIGGVDMESVVELAKLAKDLGYRAVSIVGPIYHAPTKEGLVKFYSYIASKVDIPIIIYNNKGRQGYNITPDDFEILTRDIPNVVGVKDTSYDVEQLLELAKRFSSKYFIAGGGDNLLYYTFAVGAHAHICGISNVFPELAVGIFRAMSDGDHQKALELQYKILLLRKAIRKYNVETQEVLRVMLSIRGVKSGQPPIQLSFKPVENMISDLKHLVEAFSKP
jgi:4-hydroxy-tetrahydrodipicolinate synthase